MASSHPQIHTSLLNPKIQDKIDIANRSARNPPSILGFIPPLSVFFQLHSKACGTPPDKSTGMPETYQNWPPRLPVFRLHLPFFLPNASLSRILDGIRSKFTISRIIGNMHPAPNSSPAPILTAAHRCCPLLHLPCAGPGRHFPPRNSGHIPNALGHPYGHCLGS